MNDQMDEKFEFMKEELSAFKGDKALFWAGRMSQTIKMMSQCLPMELSYYVRLLNMIREEYDKIIFSRVK